MHASIGGVGVIYPDTSFVDNRDMDKINPILQKCPNTVDGPALEVRLPLLGQVEVQSGWT